MSPFRDRPTGHRLGRAIGGLVLGALLLVAHAGGVGVLGFVLTGALLRHLPRGWFG